LEDNSINEFTPFLDIISSSNCSLVWEISNISSLISVFLSLSCSCYRELPACQTLYVDLKLQYLQEYIAETLNSRRYVLYPFISVQGQDDI
jgi:hypothetical protein